MIFLPIIHHLLHATDILGVFGSLLFFLLFLFVPGSRAGLIISIFVFVALDLVVDLIVLVN
jgi:hypothetical protein